MHPPTSLPIRISQGAYTDRTPSMEAKSYIIEKINTERKTTRKDKLIVGN